MESIEIRDDKVGSSEQCAQAYCKAACSAVLRGARAVAHCHNCSLVPSAPPPPLQPLTKQLRAAARSGKGKFLLMTFKEVFDNITAGERGSVGPC